MFKTCLSVLIIVLIVIFIGLDNDLPKNGESYVLYIPNFEGNINSVLAANRFGFDDDESYLIRIPKDTDVRNISNFVRNDTLWCEGIFHKMCFKEKVHIEPKYFKFQKFVKPIDK